MTSSISRGQLAIFALLGFGVWFSGAVMFRFGGHLMFESGPLAILISAVVIAASVCLLLNATMAWRGASAAQAVTIAVAMALPGLFGDAAYILAFPIITGLKPLTVAPYAAVIVFGNAVLLAFAVLRAETAHATRPRG
jgi:hypothetical protein